MSDIHDPGPSDQPSPSEQPPLTVIPVVDSPRTRSRTSRTGGICRFLFQTLFGMSLGFCLVILIFAGLVFVAVSSLYVAGSSDTLTSLHEHYHSGNKDAKNKIAVVRIEGVLM